MADEQTAGVSDKKQKINLVFGVQPGQVFLPAMGKIYRNELDKPDLGQLLDELAACYETIVNNIQSQMEAQS